MVLFSLVGIASILLLLWLIWRIVKLIINFDRRSVSKYGHRFFGKRIAIFYLVLTILFLGSLSQVLNINTDNKPIKAKNKIHNKSNSNKDKLDSSIEIANNIQVSDIKSLLTRTKGTYTNKEIMISFLLVSLFIVIFFGGMSFYNIKRTDTKTGIIGTFLQLLLMPVSGIALIVYVGLILLSSIGDRYKYEDAGY